MVFSLCIFGLNQTKYATAADDIIYLVKNEDGTFFENNNQTMSTFNSTQIIPVKFINSDVVQNIENGQILMRYSENKFTLANKNTFSSSNLETIENSSLQLDTKNQVNQIISHLDDGISVTVIQWALHTLVLQEKLI